MKLYLILMLSIGLIAFSGQRAWSQEAFPSGKWTNDTIIIELTDQGIYRLYVDQEEISRESSSMSDITYISRPHPLGWCLDLYVEAVEQPIAHVLMQKLPDGNIEFINLSPDSPIITGAVPKGPLSGKTCRRY